MKARTEIASATGEFAQTLYGLTASDLGESPPHPLNGLAGVESKARESSSRVWSFSWAQASRTFIPAIVPVVELDYSTLRSANECAKLINSTGVGFPPSVYTIFLTSQHLS